MTRVTSTWLAILLVFGAVLILLDWPATLTDEDDYMPYALDDVLNARNPYTTTHSESYAIDRPWDHGVVSWVTTYPYLPTLLFLQIPFIDYRWTALLSYGLLLVAVRERPLAFYAFANPLIAWLAASGFNDFAPFALIAWSQTGRMRALEWIAAAAKQLMLPIVAIDCVIRQEWARLGKAAAWAVALTAPLALLDVSAFFASAFGAHADKAGAWWTYHNYWLYPLFILAVIVPPALAERRARVVDGAPS